MTGTLATMSSSALLPDSFAGRNGAGPVSISHRPRMPRGKSTCRILSVMAAVLSLFANPSAQQRDPIKNFCRRFGHQTAVVDNKLFIDGGLVNWNPISTYADNYTNTWLLYQDLDTVASSGMPQLQANLSKNASIPSVHGGALWADDVNKRLFLFGGEYLSEPPAPFDLYAYDVLHDHWEDLGVPRSEDIERISYGASVSVSERGEGYYYGGWLSNTSVPGWGDAPPVATSMLIKYDMDSGEWANITGPDDVRRAEGAMLFLPAGDGGLLIYLGGVTDLDSNGTAVGQAMDTIFIYDVLSGKWYTQKTTGQVPEQRRRFCAGVTWPEDQSSYNIYLYGGAVPADEEGAGFDDLYILTMPTFAWIKMYPDRNTTGDYPHHSLSCNMAPGSAQMIIIGGHFPLMEDCDVPEQWGTHNADLGRQNDDESPWALYEPGKTRYVVPSDVFDVVGGGESGAATKNEPEDGFDHADIGILLKRKADIAERKPTRDISSDGKDSSAPPGHPALSTGPIIGIAIGGALVLLALLITCVICLRRRHRKGQGLQQQPPFPSPGYPYHNSVSEAGWSPAQTSALASSPSPYAQAIERDRAPSALTVPPYMGPPIELPSDGSLPGPQNSEGTATGSSGQRTVVTSEHASTSSRAAPPKYDAPGTVWVPQAGMIQVSPGTGLQYGHHRAASGQTPPVPSSPGIAVPQQGHQGRWPHQHSPATTPRSENLPGCQRSFTELNDGRGRPENESPRHETYYHP